jgi:hypothetical protein
MNSVQYSTVPRAHHTAALYGTDYAKRRLHKRLPSHCHFGDLPRGQRSIRASLLV